MELTNDAAGVDADRLDSGRAPWRPVALSLLLGVLIGALLGGAYGSTRSASYQATTALSVLPDSLVNTQLAQNAPTVDSTSFIQSQLVILNGSQLAGQVQNQLKLSSSPSVSSTQVGQSYVVQVTATADTRAAALEIADATATQYGNQRATQLSTDIKASVASITTQLANVRASLATAQASTPITDGLTPSETALQTEYERLLSVQSALNLALPQVKRVVSVLSPASVAPTSFSATGKDIIGGGLVGALLGLTVLISLRRFVTRTRTVADVAGLGVPVLLPVLPRRSGRSGSGAAAWRSAPARLLAARLTGQGSGEPIIVVGATRGVGASFVAASLATGLIERGPVLLILASELTNGAAHRALQPAPEQSATLPAHTPESLARLLTRAVPSEIDGLWLLPCSTDDPAFAGSVADRSSRLSEILDQCAVSGWFMLVDAPALSDSDLALDLARGSAVATLVVGRSKSRQAEVVSAAELFDAHNSELSGAIINDVPRGLFQPRRSSVLASAAPESTANSAAVAPGRLVPAQRAGDGRRRAAGSAHARRDSRRSESAAELGGFATDIVPFPPDTGR